MKHTTNTATEFSDRIRFNWGYHDGADDVKNSRRPLWETRITREQKRLQDPAWMDGYEMGEAAQIAGTYNGNSDEAWEERETR